MSHPTLLVEREGDIAVITLNDPERMNAFGRPMQEALAEAIAEIGRDTAVSAVVLTGAGRAFCAGADLTAARDPLPEGVTGGQRTSARMREFASPLILSIRALPVPVISALNGAVAGAGVGLGLAADYIVAGRSAYFYLPFMAKLGILPDLGSTWFLSRAIGSARAMALTLMGNRLPAEKAAEWGLVAECVDDDQLRSRAMEVAAQLAALPAHAALETRRAYEAAHQNTLQQQLEYEAMRQGPLQDLPEYIEGVLAFREKRQPKFVRRR